LEVVMPIQFVGPALQGASMIGRFGVPVLQQAGISAGLAGLGAAAAAISNKTASSSQGARRGAAGKPRGSGFSSISSDQLPPGAYMTEAGRVYGMDSEQVSKAGGYMDEMGRVFLPNGRQVAQTTQRPPMPGLRKGYKEQELAAGAAAERFRPGAGFPGQQSAADRAYEAEKSRVAQLTAQDPELQRYKKARKDAKTQEEMNAARDIGMQIWQQKYGGTPMGQPGGAVGMDNPLMLKTFGYQSGSAPGQQMGAYTQGPTPNIPQIDQMLNPAGPSYLGGEGAPLINFADENFTPEMIEAYQKQLLGQAAARK
jgi:hypothetical protein